jgi:hypothetical protein
MTAPVRMAGAVGAAAGCAVGWVMAGAVLVGTGGGGAGVFGGGVLGAGAGGGASDINTASTVFSVMRTTLRAKPEEIAQSISTCSTTTRPMPVRCLLGERWRAAYGLAAEVEYGD